jgi:NADPH:quinone reductase-like Zn-dependent oxidoreductase
MRVIFGLVLLAAAPSHAVAPSSMTAVRASGSAGPGDFSKVSVVTNLAVPKPGLGEILIAVNHSSVNPVDWKLFEKGQGFDAIIHYPHTLGFDISGTVVQCEKCKRLKVGDEVWADLGMIEPLNGGELGAYAQYAVAKESQTGLKPEGMSMAEAASLPLVALTSYQALKKTGAPWKPSDGSNFTVLITSGSGGTGFVGIQMAKAFGATFVVTATSKQNIPFCEDQGADLVVDYKTEDVLSAVPDDSLDVVYDNYGAAGTADKAMAKLKAGGVFIYLPGKGGAVSKNPKKGVKQINFGLCDSSKYADLDHVKSLADAGHLKAHIDKVFPFQQIKDAFNYSQSGQVVGKISLSM